MILRTSGIGVSIAFLREAQWGSRGREFDSRHSDQEVQRFRNRSRWTFSFFVPAADGFFACDRRNDGRNKTQKICRICRISRLKLCISPNKNLENVSILRKNNRLCLQKGYRLVYFMAVKREK